MPFFNKKVSTLIPPSGRDTYLDFYIEAVTKEILQASPKQTVYSNISKEEMNSLRSLSQDDSVVIKKADKSNMIIIMNKTDYTKEVERQLTDEKYYTELDENPSKAIEQNIFDCINKISETNSAVEREFDPIPNHVRVPQFYILPKTHKQHQDHLPIGYPGRPIVSACNSYTENISKYIDYILQPYMKSLPSFVKDTTDFINKICPQVKTKFIARHT